MTDQPITFASLGLPEALVASLVARGISAPTPVQAGVIPLALAGIGGEGGDILAQARTGSGKTLAFVLPLAAAFGKNECKRAWVVCPTRELASQVAREAALVLGPGQVATLIGGAPAYEQRRELARKPKLVVGTPGRMCDHLSQGTLAADAEVLVLDEADQMLDMGFKDELDTLVKDLGEGVARWFFSATFPPAVEDAVERWLDHPKEVRLDIRQGSSHVPQKYVVTNRGGELPALIRLLQVLEPARALVFTRTRRGVEEASQGIALAGIEAGGISGELTQDARERVLSRFRQGKLPVLVATDVAARGLDVQGVSHVFNLGLPVGSSSYTHRIGRTARAGASGEAWTVLAASERSRFLRLVAIAGCKATAAEVPTASTIVDSQRKRLAVRVQESLGEGLTLPKEFAELVAAHSADTVLAALVHRLVPDAAKEKEFVRAPAQGRSIGAMSDLFLGVGQDDGVTPAAIVAMVCRGAEIMGTQLGRLRVHPRHTLLAVGSDVAERVLGAVLHYRGRRIPVRLDRAGPATPRERPPAQSFDRPPRPPAPAAAPRSAAPPATAATHAAPERQPHGAPKDHDRERPAPARAAPAPAPRPVAPPLAAAASAPVPTKPPTTLAAVVQEPLVRVRIHIKRSEEISLRTLRKFVCKAAKVSKNAIGSIELGDTHADVEVRRTAAHVLAALGEIDVKGQTARVELPR